MLSGEGQSIQLGELRALLETYHGDSSVEHVSDRVFVVANGDYSEEIVRRGAYVSLGGPLIGEVESSRIVEGFQRLDYYPFLKDSRSFAVKVVDFSGKIRREKTEADLGASVKASNRRLAVSLDYPDIVVAVIICPTKTLVGLMRPETVQRTWSQRRPRARPFFHPSALYPKFARALVNLARVKPGDTLLDPFCGTGSILLEAGLMGIDVVGIDIRRRMCKGSLANLLKFGSDFMGVLNADATKLCINNCDAIVTDVPYGRVSSTVGRASEVILRDLVEEAKAILPDGRHAVIMSPEGTEPFDSNEFQLVDRHKIYVHRNLTRAVTVLRRR